MFQRGPKYCFFRNVLEFQGDYCFHFNFPFGSCQSLFLHKQFKTCSSSTELRSLIYIAIHIGIPVWMRVLQCMNCKITDTKQTLPSVSDWFRSLLIRVWTALSFILENNASLLFLVLFQGCYRNPWKVQNLHKDKMGFHSTPNLYAFFPLKYNKCLGWSLQWAFKMCSWKKQTSLLHSDSC